MCSIFSNPDFTFKNVFFLPSVENYELKGVDVCGEIILVITKAAQSFSWEKYGLKLHIHEESLPEDMKQCTVVIKASTSGQYKLPDSFHPVSAFFWFISHPVCKFTKSITMEMEHCARLENAANLTFMRAVCTQKSLPYIFEKTGGRFCSDSHYGTIELNGFSGKVIGQERYSKELESSSREYGARIFHITHQVTSYYIDFVVTWNTQAHLTVSNHIFM